MSWLYYFLGINIDEIANFDPALVGNITHGVYIIGVKDSRGRLCGSLVDCIMKCLMVFLFLKTAFAAIRLKFSTSLNFLLTCFGAA